MKFGASTFNKDINKFPDIVDSIEYYIPKLEIYKDRILQKDKFNELLDFRYSYDLESTMHAPYCPNININYPEDLIIDITDMNDKDIKFMKDIIDLSVKFDVEILVLHPGKIHNDDRKRSLINMTHNLNILVDYAMDSDIVIGLENKESTDLLSLGTEAKELVEIVKSIDSENLGVVFDIGHANLTCNGDKNRLKEYFEYLLDYIVHIHIHDNYGFNNGKFNGDLHLCPGLGNIDYSILNQIFEEDITLNFELFEINDIINGKSYITNLINKNEIK